MFQRAPVRSGRPQRRGQPGLARVLRALGQPSGCPRRPWRWRRCCHASAVAEGRVLLVTRAATSPNALLALVCAYDPARDAVAGAAGAGRAARLALRGGAGQRVFVMGGSQLEPRGGSAVGRADRGELLPGLKAGR